MRLVHLFAILLLQIVWASTQEEASPRSDISDLSPRQRFGMLSAIQKEMLDQWRGLRRRLVRQDPGAHSDLITTIRRIFERLDELPYPLSDRLMQLRDDLETTTTAEKLVEYMSALIDEMRDYKFFVAARVVAEDQAVDAF